MATAFTMYYLEITCRTLAASVRLNDIAVLEDPAGMKLPSRVLVNQWLYDGKNTIETRFWLPPECDPVALSEAKVTVRVLSLEKGRGEQDAKEVFSLVFPGPGEAPDAPTGKSGEFELDVPFANWAWLAGDIFTEENVPADEVQAVAEHARTSLEDRQIEATMALLKTKNAELAAAFGIPVDERLSDSRALFGRMFGTEGWAMGKPDYANMRLQLHAQGRLVEVTDLKGEPILETATLEESYTYCLPLWLAKVGGEWVLCR